MPSPSVVSSSQSAVRSDAVSQSNEISKTAKTMEDLTVKNEARKTASQWLKYLLGLGNPPSV